MGFGIIFKDIIPFEDSGVSKVKSHGIMKLSIDRIVMFEWLKSKEDTNFEELSSCMIQVESEDEQ